MQIGAAWCRHAVCPAHKAIACIASRLHGCSCKACARLWKCVISAALVVALDIQVPMDRVGNFELHESGCLLARMKHCTLPSRLTCTFRSSNPGRIPIPHPERRAPGQDSDHRSSRLAGCSATTSCKPEFVERSDSITWPHPRQSHTFTVIVCQTECYTILSGRYVPSGP